MLYSNITQLDKDCEPWESCRRTSCRREGMPEIAEIRDSVWAELEEEAEARDMTVSGLINKILREWLEENKETIDNEIGDGEDSEAEEEPEKEE